jgi:hypothetical protein
MYFPGPESSVIPGKLPSSLRNGIPRLLLGMTVNR